MDELRRHVNEAFDKGQAELGDLSGTSERLVKRALASPGPRGDNRAQYAAGVAAVLIAAVVIATFAYVRSTGQGTHGVPAHPPTANASPTPLSQPLNVPTDTPVIVYHDPAKLDQTDGLTWDGSLSGKVDWGGSLGLPNPAGNLFGTATEILDRSGRIVATGNFGAKSFQATWADDEVSFCRMVPFDYLGANGVQATLQLITLRGDTQVPTPRNVVRVGKVYEQSFIRVAACSVRQDRAVVVQSAGQGIGTAQYWVVQLSTGKILWTHNFQELTNPHFPPVPTPTMSVVASPDGEYIAVNSVSQTKVGATIYGPDGSVLSNLSATVGAFSWDASLLVTDPGTGSGPVSIVRRLDGSVVWTGPAGNGFALLQAFAEPDGANLAIGVSDPLFPIYSADPSTAGFTPVDFYLVDPNGRVLVHKKDLYF